MEEAGEGVEEAGDLAVGLVGVGLVEGGVVGLVEGWVEG